MVITRLVGMVLVATAVGCASLGPLAQIVQPPRFNQANNQPAEIRLIAPSLRNPTGGAGVRVWLEVTNPNAFGFTLSTVNATLALQGTRAATGDFPLGLPLRAGQSSVVPLDLSINFADVPNLASSVRKLATGGGINYQLDGTVGVEAGRLGTPTFGPMRLTTGELRVIR
ncbi:MAG TPA: LEA type 2 family protein [Vicinamibacterales bacterium]